MRSFTVILAVVVGAAMFSACSPQPGPQPQATPAAALSPIPKRPPVAGGRKPRAKPTHGLVIETPVPDAVLEPTATAEMSLLPRDKDLLQAVAFKKVAEVRELMGEPDQAYKQGRLLSWYFLREEEGSLGRKVCPEIQFFEGTARFVIFWTPEAMRAKIALAQRNGGIEPGDNQAASYAFTDSFKYLAVGRPASTVLADLGEPDAKRQVEGAEEWDYDTLIVENGAARRLTVVLKSGKVAEIRGR